MYVYVIYAPNVIKPTFNHIICCLDLFLRVFNTGARYKCVWTISQRNKEASWCHSVTDIFARPVQRTLAAAQCKYLLCRGAYHAAVH